ALRGHPPREERNGWPQRATPTIVFHGHKRWGGRSHPITKSTEVLNYGLEPLGLSWKKSGVNAAAPMPPKMAIVAAVPSPNSPPPPPPAPPATGAVVGKVLVTVGAAAPCGKQTLRIPPAAGSVLPAVPCSVAISPVVFFLVVRIAQPYTSTALTLP